MEALALRPTMEDKSSQSSDSIATSDEYEIVSTSEPELQQTNIVDSEKETLQDAKYTNVADVSTYILTTNNIKQGEDSLDYSCDNDNRQVDRTQMAGMDVDQENDTITSCSDPIIDDESEQSPLGLEKNTQDENAILAIDPDGALHSAEPLSRSTSEQFCDEEQTLFKKIVYLGCAAINAPRSEVEIQRNMAILNEQSSDQAIEISLSVPFHSEGTVILYEPDSNTEMSSFAIHRILFCARGRQDSSEAYCFAFTCSHGNTAETAIFQCHIFKCDSPETVVKILQCFASAFRRVPKLSSIRSDSICSDRSLTVGTSVKNNEQVYAFEASLDIKEEDFRGNFTACPKDKDYFKLRCNIEKMINMSVQQVSNNRELNIERCFGLLISPGRNVKHGDMQLIEMASMTKFLTGEKTVYHISGQWNPNDPPFEVLNTETPRNMRVYLTIAVDLVVTGIQEPVRFVMETKAKIFPQNERFWYFSKKPLYEQFYLRLIEVESENIKDHIFDVVSLESSTQLHRKRMVLSLNLSQGRRPVDLSPSTPGDAESNSDNDEPLLSGTGEVSKDCTETELAGWADVLSKWRQNLKQRPKGLSSLVRRGIPEALRGEVWQLLAGCYDDRHMMETYRLLINKESPCENVIQRDINRTFPAHNYFRESGGLGQDSLYKICKAYSMYDQEIGYCQGLSFLAAALLLHMPEEQAFHVLVKIMFDYGVRDLFRNSFEELHLKFYQLERLLEEQLPELYAHFLDLGIEAHMFGSQWFLTLFTAKFPLYVVFNILDLFLLDAMDTIFQVAVALLMMSKSDLLALDFEGVLKYFRVSLPKKYRTEEMARQLLRTAVGVKARKIKKYEKEYAAVKEEKQQENPVERLKRENKRLLESNMRLEQENDDLAHELVTSKIQLRKELDTTEDKAETLGKELLSTKTSLVEAEDEKKRLESEVGQLKEMCRRELQRTETEITRNNTIISEYKQICSHLSTRLEREQNTSKEAVEQLKNLLKGCDHCYKLLENQDIFKRGSQKKINTAKTTDKAPELLDTDKQIRELELELAQTKLALVESECKNQDLTHQLNTALQELQASKNTWFHKTLSSIRDAARKEIGGTGREGKEREAT
ncbi:rab GTPase-activating protein 1-like isoform X1 [Limulus polyphemus]|uniref:Rab GTPase-activating protein 1-like isoform X1 n=2 Tax=Limulus polyphemus TaxID=6850 RepID=A0ABM1BHN5_LIMPO|nr:rab GTPase-activating protein 1-like isoform X1 [Limulus polyphemus]XP_022250156.1 rab GTPase-activating protein 1-like isoform X1 [Limulus polyphemus]